MSRDLIDPMTKGDEPAPCAVPGCNNLSLGGDIRGPGGERISQYCPFHGMPVLLYGSLDRPSSLKGLPRCKEMIEISDWRKSKFHLEERPLPQQCSEPAIANGLCISHVAAGRDSTTIVGARECIKMWEGRLSLANEPYTSDEAWQILAEIDKIRRHGTSNSLIPRNVDSAMVAEMFIAPLFFEGPGRKERVRLAFWMSPSSIGKTLDMKPRDVMYHVRHLADTGYVELDQSYELPRSLIVTHEIRFPRKAYRSWRREKFRQKYSASKYTKIRIENLPRPNERVIEPVFDGPGIIDPDHQGQVLALTERGRAELRSWEVKLANQKQQERRHRHELVLTIILIILTSLLLISAISDAPRAWQVLQDWFTH